MTALNLHRAWWRVQSVLAKGPSHLLALGRYYTAQHLQRVRGDWRSDRGAEAAFLAQLRLEGEGASIARHFRTRTQPKFFSTTETREREAESRARTVAVADAVCRHRFTFRGEPPITFPGRVDWFHQPGSNLDWRWELNRHAYFVALGRAFAATGDPGYLNTFRELLLDWMAHNPPDVGAPNWESVLEPAYRLNVWAWAYHYFRAALDDEVLLALLRGLWWHGRFVAANLEWHVRNNHLLLQAKALAMSGLLFPEFGDARDWQTTGLRIVWQQVREQVHPDGVHGEQSTLYHQVITSELLELLALMQANPTPVPDDIRERFARMLDFERAVIKPDGEAPLLGDAALGDSYVRYDALATAEALGLISASADRAIFVKPRDQRLGSGGESCAFPQGGYFIQRCADRYLVFDCGPFGHPPAPGHGHADALHFELFANGRTLVVDPGVYSYHLGAHWRNFFRSTAAHNTVMVDEQDQSLLLGDMRVARPAHARLITWHSDAAFDVVDGAHDGYMRLPEPVMHRRQIIFVKPDYWIVLDQLAGVGVHRFDLLFHLLPEAQIVVEPDGQLARVSYPEGVGLLICPAQNEARIDVISGSANPVQGWISRYSAEKQPAPVVRYTITVPLPTEFATVMLPCLEVRPEYLSVAVHAVTDATGRVLGSETALALTIETESWKDVVVLDRRPEPAFKQFGGQCTAERVTRRRETKIMEPGQ